MGNKGGEGVLVNSEVGPISHQNDEEMAASERKT